MAEQKTITRSPLPAEVSASPSEDKVVAFPKAIAEVIEGKRITKKEWGNKEYWGELKDGWLMLRKPDGKYYTWTINDGDLLGKDWIILN